ncbi:LacI family DNA-binding transcriptional regulator [Microbacterium hominis]|uniref:LacI family DNA-binding transcriptional regulator n=2 Tax=Microbacterium hominis TaxID=162426 RepID=A0A7D4TQ73_9MICO|nr:LacI family DNA-binding transcriptional regulator [Microbacterium hominis]
MVVSDEVAARIARRGGNSTIYDVAEVAGVSPSTVSRALSKPGRISARTEERIRAAAALVAFRFNPMARALPTGRTHTLAVVVADITNPVVFGIIRGAEKAASDAGYTLVIAESQESGEAEAAAIERLMPGVDGIVLATTRLGDDRIAEIAGRKPIVLINRDVDGVPGILPDVTQGVDALMAHLAELGHRSVAFLSGPAESWISDRRWDAILDAAERLDMAAIEIGPNQPTIEGGRAVARRLLAARVDAVIAFNDLVAIGVIQAATEAGVAVPGGLSVAGFDDIFGSELVTPTLTTVRSQLALAGERAVHDLLAPPAADADAALLATELVVRRSTGAVAR